MKQLGLSLRDKGERTTLVLLQVGLEVGTSAVCIAVLLFRQILQIVQPELSIASLKTIKDTELGITKLVNEFINNVAEKKLRADQFSTELAAELMDSTMQERGSEYFKSKGKFLKSELLSRKELGNGLREYRYRLLFSKEIVGFMIQFNKENKIVDLQVKEY